VHFDIADEGPYNPELASPDTYALCRRIDDHHFEDVLSVIRWFRDIRGCLDIQNVFGETGNVVLADLIERFDISSHATTL